MKVKVIKEIRFAVVMYGGVSLAIYINGVVQELMAMVRATAIQDDRLRLGDDELRFSDEDLSANEKIYRHLAFHLARNEQTEENTGTPEIVRFIVDVISGTSAGGINGIFLATGIVGGVKLDALENIWLQEGDFAELLNDQRSVVGLDITEQKPQRSLLNSERMYVKLLDALTALGKNRPFDGTEALTDEVDLLVTTTDYWGIPTPLRLSDGLVTERRHRQHFHFRFRKDHEINDFRRDDFPFIAYVARCTSSFPVAFDPMSMAAANRIIDQTLPGTNGSHIDIATKSKSLRPAKVSGQGGDDLEIKWGERQFVDGGYLDNKPFGHAIKALGEKQSDVLVDRKLLYIEPKPEQEPEISRATNTTAPSVVNNTLAAVSALPTYETIGDELQVVLDRNRLIARLGRLLSNARIDELEMLGKASRDDLVSEMDRQRKIILKLREKDGYSGEGELDLDWNKLELSEIAMQKGQIAYPYYRLRVAAVTDELARSSTRRAGFDENSEYFQAVRLLVYHWRKQTYGRGDRGSEKALLTPMQFLSDFDHSYRLRRLRFVLSQADRLLRFDRDLSNEIAATAETVRHLSQLMANGSGFDDDERWLLKSRFSLVENEIFAGDSSSASVFLEQSVHNDRRKILNAIMDVKRDINLVLSDFRLDLARLEPNSIVTYPGRNATLIEELNEATKSLAEKVGSTGLETLIHETSDLTDPHDLEGKLPHVAEFVAKMEIGELLVTMGGLLAEIYNGPRSDAMFARPRKDIKEVFNSNGDSEVKKAVKSFLNHFYENFDAYDQIVFPATYETPVGEGVRIDVARISPLDAVSLLDEEKERRDAVEHNTNNSGKPPRQPRKKLAGDVFFSFGAFFNRSWRENDIRWGRLDGAERLLSVLLPPSTYRNSLLEDLQRNIVKGDGNLETGKITIEDITVVDRELEKDGVYATLNRAFPIASVILSDRSWPWMLSYAKSVLIATLHVMLGRPLLLGAFPSLFKHPIAYLSAILILMLPPLFAALIVYIAIIAGSLWAVLAAFALAIAFWFGLRLFIRRKLYRMVTGK